MTITQFPHCDQRVLHSPGECEHCDKRPEWQELRQAWGIAFTGHKPAALEPKCGKPIRWATGPPAHCRQPWNHKARCSPNPAWETLPCPADAARPPGSRGDHRRWGGNKPTTAEGDESWPAESAESLVMYGDKGGREPWPLGERIMRKLRRRG